MNSKINIDGKIILGSANLNNTYGYNNNLLKEKEFKKIINYLRKKNFFLIDTALNYKNSQKIIFKYITQKTKLITKLPKYDETTNIHHWLKKNIEEIFCKLKVKKVYCILLHHPNDLLGPHGKIIFNEINDLVDNYSKILNYRCSGLLFKNNSNFGDNYLFSFPECRSDSKILKNGVTIDNQKVVIEEEHKIISPKQKNHKELIVNNEEEDLFGDIENVNEQQNESSNIIIPDKSTCNFMINPTSLPDIYELYCYSSNNNIEKCSYASVPDITTSNYLKSIINFDNINENVLTKIKKNAATFVECKYHKNFKKWIPIKKTDNMDNISIINQVQITLDSAE